MLGHSRNSDFWAPGSPGGELVSIIYSHCGKWPIFFPWEIGILFNFEERELRIIIGMVAKFKQSRFEWTLSVFFRACTTFYSALKGLPGFVAHLFTVKMMIWRYCSNWLHMAWEASATKCLFERRGGGQIVIWAMPIWIPIFSTHHEEGGGGPGDRGDVGGRGWEVRWKHDVTGTQIRSNLLKIVMSLNIEKNFQTSCCFFHIQKLGYLISPCIGWKWRTWRHGGRGRKVGGCHRKLNSRERRSYLCS